VDKWVQGWNVVLSLGKTKRWVVLFCYLSLFNEKIFTHTHTHTPPLQVLNVKTLGRTSNLCCLAQTRSLDPGRPWVWVLWNAGPSKDKIPLKKKKVLNHWVGVSPSPLLHPSIYSSPEGNDWQKDGVATFRRGRRMTKRVYFQTPAFSRKSITEIRPTHGSNSKSGKLVVSVWFLFFFFF
jgi:hypothetical protein